MSNETVLFTVKTSCQRKRNIQHKIYLKKKANTDRIKQELQILATLREFNSPGVSVHDMWNHFERNMRRIMDTCIRHKMISSRYNLPWFNRSLRRQTRAKKRLYDKAKKSGNPVHWNEFRPARKRLQKNLKSAKETYISDFLGDTIKENPKRFWSYIKQLKNVDPGVSDFKVDGKIVSDGRMKSEILGKQFSSVFTNEDPTTIPAVGTGPKPSIDPLIVTIQELSSSCSL